MKKFEYNLKLEIMSDLFIKNKHKLYQLKNSESKYNFYN